MEWRRVDHTGQSWTGFVDGYRVAQVVHYDRCGGGSDGWIAHVGDDRLDGCHGTTEAAMAAAETEYRDRMDAELERRIADLDAGEREEPPGP